ncbi:protein kinase-like protein [Xylariomycetidae sp. FL0641]|nr:protein kinase-like protein [Xylariomycetidae sp. FL0641]
MGEDLEDVQDYNKGGHHPVHLGDRFLDGRLEVIHKLGFGGFGMIWFCRDTEAEKWRALKILSAEHSAKGVEEKIYDHLQAHATSEELDANHIAVPLERFWIDGPNGRHLCFVMPVFGLHVGHWSNTVKDHEDIQGSARKINAVCCQIVKALKYLHGHGICHGDLKPSNILMRIEGLDDMTEERLMDLMEPPRAAEVQTLSGAPPGDRAPEYCVYKAEEFWSETLVIPTVAMIDFGEAFFMDDPPKMLGTPVLYSPPEVIFSGTRPVGHYSDIWSLACTLFEIRHKGPLFTSYQSVSVTSTVESMEIFLGPLPEPYRAALKRRWQASMGNEFSGITEDTTPYSELGPLTCTKEYHEEIVQGRMQNTSLSNLFESILGSQRRYSDWQTDDDTIEYRYPQKDVSSLSDLLTKMLRYDPTERFTINQVFAHPWIGGLASSPTTSVPSGTWKKLSLLRDILCSPGYQCRHEEAVIWIRNNRLFKPSALYGLLPETVTTY